MQEDTPKPPELSPPVGPQRPDFSGVTDSNGFKYIGYRDLVVVLPKAVRNAIALTELGILDMEGEERDRLLRLLQEIAVFYRTVFQDYTGKHFEVITLLGRLREKMEGTEEGRRVLYMFLYHFTVSLIGFMFSHAMLAFGFRDEWMAEEKTYETSQLLQSLVLELPDGRRRELVKEFEIIGHFTSSEAMVFKRTTERYLKSIESALNPEDSGN